MKRSLPIFVLIIVVFAFVSCKPKATDVKTLLTNDFVCIDQSRLLTPEQKDELSTLLQAHNQKGPGTVSLMIVDQVSTSGPKDIQSFVETKVNGKADRIICVLSVKNHRLKLSWSEEMSTQLTDDVRKQIMDKIVVKFREGNYYGGFKIGVSSLIDKLEGRSVEQPN
jgi:uncharacterized membrane protein YgcG